MLNNEIIRWTSEGLDDGAENLLIIKNTTRDYYYPCWVMPHEDIDEVKRSFQGENVIVDVVSLSLMRQLFIGAV